MRQLMLALYAEGSTDANIDEDSGKRLGFLPLIIQRTADAILHEKSSTQITVELPFSRWKKPDGIKDQDRRILYIAGQTAGYDALIIHSDSDKRGYETTLAELFQPGKDLVLESARNNPDDVCAHLVPLIPVHMTEAWMLADSDALCKGLKIDKKTAQSLGLLLKVKEVESEANPKKTLQRIIKYADLKKQNHPTDIYKELGSLINLKRLSEVPSYRQFVENMTATLQTLNFIQK